MTSQKRNVKQTFWCSVGYWILYWFLNSFCKVGQNREFEEVCFLVFKYFVFDINDLQLQTQQCWVKTQNKQTCCGFKVPMTLSGLCTTALTLKVFRSSIRSIWVEYLPCGCVMLIVVITGGITFVGWNLCIASCCYGFYFIQESLLYEIKLILN